MDGSEDLIECKKCRRIFQSLGTHLRYNEECKAVYTEEEIDARKKLLRSAKSKRYADNNQEKVNEYKRQYNSEHREEIGEKQKQYWENRKKNWTADDRLEDFLSATRRGWSFPCGSCHKKHFRHQVIALKPEAVEHLLDMQRVFNKKESLKKYICRTCYPFLRDRIEAVNHWRELGFPRAEAMTYDGELENEHSRKEYEAWVKQKYEAKEKAAKEDPTPKDLTGAEKNFMGWMNKDGTLPPDVKLCNCFDPPHNGDFDFCEHTKTIRKEFKECTRKKAAFEAYQAAKLTAKESESQQNSQQECQEDSQPGNCAQESIPQLDGDIGDWMKLSPQEVIMKAWNEGMKQEVLQIHSQVKRVILESKNESGSSLKYENSAVSNVKARSSDQEETETSSDPMLKYFEEVPDDSQEDEDEEDDEGEEGYEYDDSQSLPTYEMWEEAYGSEDEDTQNFAVTGSEEEAEEYITDLI